MAKFEGRGACDCCKAGVDVYSDKNGLAYYNCGPCGVRLLHRKARTSAAFIARIDRHAEPDDGTPPAALPVAPPAAAPAAAPVAPGRNAPPPPKQKKAGFLSNFTL